MLCATYNQSAEVHMINSHYYYSISLTFPFIYESNITVQASPDLPLRKFTFDTLLLPSTITFVAATSLAFIVAIVVFIFNLTHQGLQEVQDYIKLVRKELDNAFNIRTNAPSPKRQTWNTTRLS